MYRLTGRREPTGANMNDLEEAEDWWSKLDDTSKVLIHGFMALLRYEIRKCR